MKAIAISKAFPKYSNKSSPASSQDIDVIISYVGETVVNDMPSRCYFFPFFIYAFSQLISLYLFRIQEIRHVSEAVGLCQVIINIIMRNTTYYFMNILYYFYS